VTATLPRVAVALTLLTLLIAPAKGGSPLKVEVDKTRVDLAARKLEVRMNHRAGKVELKVFGATGDAPLARAEHDFSGHAAGDALTVTWPDPGSEVARIDLRAYDADGLWVGLALIPWSVYIPHEEVNFATDSAAIAATESPKLDGSLKLITDAVRKHRELGAIKLFIAGHTDTVGATGYNLKLSQKRAQSIASWFRSHGLRVPIFYEGFGEQALLVATPDETDEGRNRRVDYILAVEEPALKSATFHAAWKRIQ
jgi:outer membrane protein OmpA-like peptidoglycan-associated protein